ncbi:ankyrin repeat domain-containing protein [Gaetbulibacter saemankumensis]|uniref:ankyrin repeat domain-containing protein n=1 Tax=Gaetbulibacter saemankumensis TaxID=311208 RepID=UPI0003F891D4|nr:ankyrin repeat domain-containing protein [Gaetbulibacter saemankumensis]
MKKSIIITAIALSFSLVTVNATSKTSNFSNYKAEVALKVNSFCVSIAKGDLETVKKLLARGEDVNQKSNGMTPAMYAAKFNRTEILKLLIEQGAKLKTRSEKGHTALEYAKMHGATDAAKILEVAMEKK